MIANARGYRDRMTEHERDEERAETRSELLPEEEAAGSEAPLAQAAEILEESDERTADPEGTQRRSTQTPDAHQPTGEHA